MFTKHNYIEFNTAALEVVRSFGYLYYAIITDVENEYSLQVFPFKTLERANIFMAEYGYLGSHFHYILEDGEVLQELSEGVELVLVEIAFPNLKVTF